MKHIIIATFFLCIGFTQSVWASNPDLNLIQSPELKTWMSEATPPVIYDANGTKTRTGEGIIQGAKLLSSSGSYDVAKELPADQNTRLVFYCYNEQCTASHTAARRAIEAGYTNVSVLSDGIIGWKMARGAVEKP